MTRLIHTDGHDHQLPARRKVIGLIAAGAGLMALLRRVGLARSAPPDAPEELEPPVDVGGREQEIVAEAYRLGYEYERQYGGCAQCTVAALQDAIPFLAADQGLFRGASCLDGGSTPTGIQNCGSFTGAAMVIGYLCGRRRNGTFEGSTQPSHNLVRKLYSHFEQRYGSVLCKDVREKAHQDCPEVVGLAAQWTAQILVDTFCGQPTAEADSAAVPEDAE